MNVNMEMAVVTVLQLLHHS